MGKKKGMVINRQWVRMEIVTAIVIALGIWGILTREDGDEWISWGLLLFGITTFVVAFWLAPHFCYVDPDGIRITYAFGQSEAAWQKIRTITCSWNRSLHHWEKEYQFIGLSGERFYMDGRFIKSRKLTRLLTACGADKLIEKE